MSNQVTTNPNPISIKKERALTLFIEMDKCFRNCKSYKRMTRDEKAQAFQDAAFIYMYLNTPSV